MAADEGDRKLAAILAADVAGYSRLMADDDRATIGTLTEYREVFSDRVAAHKGHIVDTAGDSVLATFDSVVEAVEAAVEIQGALSERNEALPDHRRMHFRIGINLGDIIIRDDGTAYGDGVNVAARLEGLAVAGGIMISQTAYDQVEGRLDVGLADAGAHEVKNIAKPVRAYRILAEGEVEPVVSAKARERFTIVASTVAVVAVIVALVAWQYLSGATDDIGRKGSVAEVEDELPPLPTGPTIAVLPFDNLGGDPEQEYFADGLTEDILTRLAAFRDLKVIGRNSSFQYKGEAVDLRVVGRELGADFILEGSVRRDASSIRVAAQLLDTSEGVHVWAETYDRDLSASSIFAIQDEITEQVASALGGTWGAIATSEIQDIRSAPTDSLKSYECILLAKQYAFLTTPERHLTARECLIEVVAKEPNYVDALAWLGQMYMEEMWSGYNPRDAGPTSLDAAFEVLIQAARLDSSHQKALSVLAWAYFADGDDEQFYDTARKAVAANPDNPETLTEMAMWIGYSGRWDESNTLGERLRSLGAEVPSWHNFTEFNYHYRNKNYAAAAASARATLDVEHWAGPWYLALAYAGMGENEKANEALAKARAFEPNLTTETVRGMVDALFRDETHISLLIEGHAGLLEIEKNLASRPVIAVLPFDNMSGDPEQEYFADGITESLISALANSGAIDAIARTSMLKYKGQAIDVREIGRDLGAGYVLEGTVRKSAGQIRISAKLLNAADATHLWSKTYEYPLTADSIFRVQDELTEQVVFAIGGAHGVIAEVRLANTRSRPTDLLDAYDCILRSFHYYTVYTPEEHLKVRSCLRRAVELDPEYDVAWSRLANIVLDEHRFMYNPEPEPLDRALEAARTGITLNPQSQYGHNVIAMVYFHRHEIDLFRIHMEKAIELGEYRSELVANVGAYLYFSGDFERGYELMERALDLTPNSPGWYQSHRFWEGIRHQNYEASVEAARIYHTKTPGFYWPHLMGAAAYALLGKAEQAQAEVGKLLELRPNFTAAAQDELTFWFWTPEGQEIVDRTLEGLRLAGLDVPLSNEGND
jgi:adenylate cyclase